MMNRKKLTILVVCIFLVSGLGVGIYLMNNSKTNRIEKNGFSFRYPKTLQLQEIPSTEGNYANFQINNSNSQIAKSSITISIPLKNTSIAFTLADNIKPVGNPDDVKTTSLNRHRGQTITYRQDTNYPGDIPVHGTITYELYPTKYETSPVLIRYFKDDADATLDTFWKAIRESITY